MVQGQPCEWDSWSTVFYISLVFFLRETSPKQVHELLPLMLFLWSLYTPGPFLHCIFLSAPCSCYCMIAASLSTPSRGYSISGLYLPPVYFCYLLYYRNSSNWFLTPPRPPHYLFYTIPRTRRLRCCDVCSLARLRSLTIFWVYIPAKL